MAQTGVRPQTRQRRRPGSDPFGFTLVELLVSLAIFALLSGFAYRGLNAMLESREALQQESRKWRDLSVFMGRLERDLSAVLNREAIGASSTRLAPVSSSIEVTTARDGLAFTRSGALLNENALAAPQRVAYRLIEDRIERLTWASVDSAPRAEPVAVPVLRGVKAFGLRFLDPRGEWRSAWGLPGSPERIPAAVEITLQLASGEKLVRLVDLPRTGP